MSWQARPRQSETAGGPSLAGRAATRPANAASLHSSAASGWAERAAHSCKPRAGCSRGSSPPPHSSSLDASSAGKMPGSARSAAHSTASTAIQ
eukprot:scaffold94700_cov65-Phaeocystis_antarctica.AAC.2